MGGGGWGEGEVVRVQFGKSCFNLKPGQSSHSR